MIATFEERVRFHTDRALHHPSNRINFNIGDARRLSSTPHNGVDTRCGKNRKPMDERSAQEDITREKGKGDSLDAVFPLMSGGVEGEERFKPFTRQHLMDNLLMLMPSVKSVPGIAAIEVCHRRISLYPEPDSSAI
jgi:hypothetical protein